jgi:hypothetical protein
VKHRRGPRAFEVETILLLRGEGGGALQYRELAGVVQVHDVAGREDDGGVASFAAFGLPLHLAGGGVEGRPLAFCAHRRSRR